MVKWRECEMEAGLSSYFTLSPFHHFTNPQAILAPPFKPITHAHSHRLACLS